MKRVREDGGISRRAYEDQEAQEGNGKAVEMSNGVGIPRASEHVLRARKIYSNVRTKEHELRRQLAALNEAFTDAVTKQFGSNKQRNWCENIREYLSYVREIQLRFGSQHGDVLTFGSGDCGQLAHGVDEDDDMMVPFPRVVKLLERKSIVRVACGGLHSAAITNDGQVFTWGCNDDGALGRSGEENLPERVPGFGPQEAHALQVVGGDCHTAVATLAGEVFTWGSYKDKEGKLWCDAASSKDSFKQKQVRPFRIASLTNVVDLRCGSTFNLARTNDGQVFSWGLGEMGQLGREVIKELKDKDDNYKIEEIYRQHLQPARVTLGKDTLPPVKAIGCGSYHSLFALSENGYLYTCGLNNYGQLGIGSTENSAELELVEDLSNENICQVEGGTHHSVVLTITGKVYSFGRADSGQLGVLDKCQTGDFRNRPQKVSFSTSAASVSMIACGSNHTVALTASNELFAWGYGDMLALGNGIEQDELRPKRMDWSKTKFGQATILQIDAGGQHSAVLAKKDSKEV